MWNKDCKEFNGIIACDELKYNKIEDCSECRFPRLFKERILIIKLGAKGDVVRSLSVLNPIRKKHDNPHITWLITEGNKQVLDGQKIDRVLTLNQNDLLRLDIEEFDHIYNLEYDLPSTALANKIQGKNKMGFYLDKKGLPAAYSAKGQHFLDIAISDAKNKKNTKTYQEMIFDALDLEYNQDKYKLKIDKEYKQQFMEKNGIRKEDTVIGINLGTAKRWPSKAWKKDNIIQLIKQLPYKVLILGGPHEVELQQEIVQQTQGIPNNPRNTDKEFFSVVDICNVVVTGDSFALHVALGRRKKAIALIFCTAAQEIETYGLTTKLVSPLVNHYYYTEEDNDELRSSISIEQVHNAILKALE